MSRLFMSYLQDAARVRLEIAPFEADQEFEKKGGSIVYAVDTNVVLLQTAPSTRGVQDGYSVVFHDDDHDTAAALAAALASFLFWELSSRPLALLIGHAAETRSLFNELTNELDHDIGALELERQELRRILSLLSLERDAETRLRLLEKHTPTLLQYLYYDSGAQAQIRRFSQLLNDGRIRRLTSLIDEEGFLSPLKERSASLRKLFLVPSTIRDQIEESRYKLDWLERFAATDHHKPKSRRADATALARLELINRRAADQAVKVVLISGDQTMIGLAKNYYPFGQQAGSFAELFIRHPRAFISAPQVLTPGSASPAPKGKGNDLLVEWLDTLLAKYTSDEGIVPAMLRALVNNDINVEQQASREIETALRLDPKAPFAIRDQWRDHLKRLGGANSFAGPTKRRELLALLEARDAKMLENGLASLGAELTKQTEHTWEIFMSAVVRAGFDLTLAETDWAIRRRRNAPPILFDSFSGATAFCRMILTSHRLAGIDPIEFNRRLAPVSEEDQTGYAKLLAFAVVFAQAGRWHVAGLLANRAVAVAEQINLASRSEGRPIDTSIITGREAYYLRAVCLRFKARVLDDFVGIEHLLDRAEAAYEKDRRRNPSLTQSAFRFSAERLSLRLNRCLLRLFAKDGENVKLLEEAHIILLDLSRLAFQLREIPRWWVQAVVERNVLTNIYLMLAIIEQHAGPSRQLDEIGRQHFVAYDENVKRGDPEKEGFPSTWLVIAVFWHAIARFGKVDKRVRADALEDIMRLEYLIAHEPDEVLFSPYDRRRFELLISLARRELGLRK